MDPKRRRHNLDPFLPPITRVLGQQILERSHCLNNRISEPQNRFLLGLERLEHK